MTKRKFSKRIRVALFFPLLFMTLSANAQNELPNTIIKTTKGKSISFSSLCQAKDTTILVTFWATWCMPCINELESLNDIYPEWQEENAILFFAVSVDDARTSARVNSFVKGKGWTFDVYLDPNNDLKRALNINDVPHLIVIKNGEIKYQKSGYIPGSEADLLNKLKSL